MFEGIEDVRLRWCDRQRNIILTGVERAEQAEALLAQEQRRAERLAERLRALGVAPDRLEET